MTALKKMNCWKHFPSIFMSLNYSYSEHQRDLRKNDIFSLGPNYSLR